ncbi:MAG: inositol monophosphatase [Nitrospirales bacterium]|nr:inositol monophosphatase [Nitrospirales bacterium]
MIPDSHTLFKLPSSAYEKELTTIHKALRLASDRIRKLSSAGLIIHTKPDGSPVTNADLEVDGILREHLLEAFPEDGWLSEERPDHPVRLRLSRVWILDPIDGTRPFTYSLPQFTISLALLNKGHLALGMIVNPATQEYYSAIQGMGAYLNGRILNHPAQTPSTSHAGSRPTFLVNPGSLPRNLFNEWKASARCPPILGSIAYSLGMVASGQVHGVINLGQQYEWDIAAGALIVQEAGGIVLDRHQRPISLNQLRPMVDGIIAVHPCAFPLVQRFLQSVP